MITLYLVDCPKFNSIMLSTILLRSVQSCLQVYELPHVVFPGTASGYFLAVHPQFIDHYGPYHQHNYITKRVPTPTTDPMITTIIDDPSPSLLDWLFVAWTVLH
jgi:hypothetical protein